MTTIRSDVVGSLSGRRYLKEARQRRKRGSSLQPTSSASRTVPWTRRSASREEAGLDVLTDGEMRRYAFFGHLIDSLDGFG